MTLRQLLNEVLDAGNIFKVTRILKEYYYFEEPVENIEHLAHSYMSVCAELLEKDTSETSDKLIVQETFFEDAIPPEKGIDVCISNHDESDLRAIDLVPWTELIDMEVTDKLNLKPEKILAHILWEITFYGYTEDTINTEHDKLKALIERVESGEEKLIPWEGVKKELNELDEELPEKIDD